MLVVVVVILGIGAAAFFLMGGDESEPKSGTPEATIAALRTAVDTRDAEGVCAVLSANALKQVEESQNMPCPQAMVVTLFIADGKIDLSGFKVDSVDIDGSRAQVKLSGSPESVPMVLAEGKWLIDDGSRFGTTPS